MSSIQSIIGQNPVELQSNVLNRARKTHQGP